MVDIDDNDNARLVKELDEANAKRKKFGEHFDHMCESGYDPLICINRVHNFVKFGPGGKPTDMTMRNQTQFMDRIITKERYIELLMNANTKVTDLDDIIFVPSELVAIKMGSVVGITAAVFWLYPSGCRTLGDLFKKYEKKIKNELQKQVMT